MLRYNKRNKNIARKLREGMTEAEKKLWQKLRKKQLEGLQFYRQKPIGNYVVDFYCPAVSLVIELDGDQHFYGENKRNDEKRDLYLNQKGLCVLRFGNNDVYKSIDSVMDKIYLTIRVGAKN